jgi:hypothetical protein
VSALGNPHRNDKVAGPMTRRDCQRTSAAAVASWALPPAAQSPVTIQLRTHPATSPASQSRCYPTGAL